MGDAEQTANRSRVAGVAHGCLAAQANPQSLSAFRQSYDGNQFSGGLTQTLIDRSLGWCRLAFWFGLTHIPIDLTRVFPWTCRPPGNALRRGFVSKMPRDPRRA